MAGIRYSLANYKLRIQIPTSLASMLSADNSINTIELGGSESYLESISVKMSKDMWSTEGDDTGSWIHTRSLNRTGECSVSLNMLSASAMRLRQLCNIYYMSTTQYDGLNMGLFDNNGNEIASMNDCFITQIPEMSFSSEASNQTWTFACGQVIIH